MKRLKNDYFFTEWKRPSEHSYAESFSTLSIQNTKESSIKEHYQLFYFEDGVVFFFLVAFKLDPAARFFFADAPPVLISSNFHAAKSQLG